MEFANNDANRYCLADFVDLLKANETLSASGTVIVTAIGGIVRLDLRKLNLKYGVDESRQW